MNIIRMSARRFEDERMNEEIPPQVEQVGKVPQGGKESKVIKVPKCLTR